MEAHFKVLLDSSKCTQGRRGHARDVKGDKARAQRPWGESKVDVASEEVRVVSS
jgi:hypothetical protein